MKVPTDAVVVKKGFEVDEDSYSAFGGRLAREAWPFDTADTAPDLRPEATLKELIESKNIERLWVTGIAIDYCVKNSILDALGKNAGGAETAPEGLKEVILVEAAARGVAQATIDTALETMKNAGAYVLDAKYQDPLTSLQAYCSATAHEDSNQIPSGNNVPAGATAAIVLLALSTVGLALYVIFMKHAQKNTANSSSTDKQQNVKEYAPPVTAEPSNCEMEEGDLNQ